MADSHQALVRQQFDRQVSHYLSSSAMADRTLLSAIIAAVPIEPGNRVLDVACGAGFLLRGCLEKGAEVFGVDLSEAMLREAKMTLGPSVLAANLRLADSADLPFQSETFDAVTCKLAFHYFSEPHRVANEMVRVCRKRGRIVVVDRITPDNAEGCAAQNTLEKLRTPNKVRVYTESELISILQSAGLAIATRQLFRQQMNFEEWMAAAGALDRLEAAKRLLLPDDAKDITGLAPRVENGALVIGHRTLILVAHRVD